MNRILPASAAPLPATVAYVPQAYVHPGFSLEQVFSIVHAHRRRSLMIAGAILFTILLVIMVMPKTYEATATLMVDFDVNDPLAGKEFPTSLMSNYLSTQKELIKSPAILLTAVDKLDLTKNKEYISGYSKKAGDLRYFVVEKVAKNLEVEFGNYGSQLLYIRYAAHNAAEAALFANTIAQIYADQQYRRINDPADERAQRYKKQLDELRQNVDKAQAEVTDFRKKTGMVEFNSRTNIGDERLTDLEHRLLEAQEMRRGAEAQVGRSEVQDQTLNSSTVQTLKNTLATQQAKLAELQTTLGPMHPQLLELKQQIAATKSSLQGEYNTYAGNVSADIAGARQREAQLRAAVEAERSRVLNTRQSQDEGSKYVIALEAARSMYQRALDGYDQVLLASGGRYSNVSFVSEASPPIKASKPDKPKILAVALPLALLLGFGGTFLYELFNRRVRCRDDIERDLGMPVLAEFGIPALRRSAA